MGEVFTFVDATHLISKASLWEERDEAKKQKFEKQNNEVLPKVARDKQAKIGCKGGSSVDIQSGKSQLQTRGVFALLLLGLLQLGRKFIFAR